MTTQQIIWGQINPTPSGGGATVATGTDANTTMASNTIYVTDMSAWATADRNYTCPASPTVGDVVGVDVTVGNASFELIIKGNTSQTINGGSAASEWSRLMMTGESVLLRYDAGNKWIVEVDGRIPIKVVALSNAASLVQNTVYHPNWDTLTVDNSSAFSGTSIDNFVLRRAGVFLAETELLSPAYAALAGIYADIISDPNGTPIYIGQSMRLFNSISTSSARIGAMRSTMFLGGVDTKITAEFLSDGVTGNTVGAEFCITEVLP